MDEMRLMPQSLLADRFKMVARHETREFPVYAAVMKMAQLRLKINGLRLDTMLAFHARWCAEGA